MFPDFVPGQETKFRSFLDQTSHGKVRGFLQTIPDQAEHCGRVNRCKRFDPAASARNEPGAVVTSGLGGYFPDQCPGNPWEIDRENEHEFGLAGLEQCRKTAEGAPLSVIVNLPNTGEVESELVFPAGHQQFPWPDHFQNRDLPREQVFVPVHREQGLFPAHARRLSARYYCGRESHI